MKIIRPFGHKANAALSVVLAVSLYPSVCSTAGNLPPTTIPAQTKPGDLFIAANGAASNPGTQNSPTTLESALTRLPPGHTIWARGGAYQLSHSITIASGNNGAPNSPKSLRAYGNEVPVFDFSGQPVAAANRGLTLSGSFWHLKGLIIEHAGDNGIYISGSSNTIELCETRFNADSGMQLGRAATSVSDRSQWPSHNLILNCTSHDNKDPGNENADGFACKLTTGTGNIFRGCISHHNIDDGWDLYTKKATGPIGPVLIENCIAYDNGPLSDGTTSGSGDKNGFKLGGSGIAVPHTIRHCVAFNNGHHGFTDNNNPGPITVTDNIGYHNSQCNFNFRKGGVHVFTNNLSLQGGATDKTSGVLTGTTNVFWDKKKGSALSASDFVSLTPPRTIGRHADGSPDLGDFLRLKPNSPFAKAGH